MTHRGRPLLPVPAWLWWFLPKVRISRVSGRVFWIWEVHNVEFPDSQPISQPMWPLPLSGSLPKTRLSSFSVTPPPPPFLSALHVDSLFVHTGQSSSHLWPLLDHCLLLTGCFCTEQYADCWYRLCGTIWQWIEKPWCAYSASYLSGWAGGGLPNASKLRWPLSISGAPRPICVRSNVNRPLNIWSKDEWSMLTSLSFSKKRK